MDYNEFLVDLPMGILGNVECTVDYTMEEDKPSLLSVWIMHENNVFAEVTDLLTDEGFNTVYHLVEDDYASKKQDEAEYNI